MRKLFSWFMGFGLGAALGGIVVLLLAPLSGGEFSARLKQHYEEALEAGRKAAEQRRAELEKQLPTLYKNSEQ